MPVEARAGIPFTTTRWRGGDPLWLEAHLGRLASTAAHLGRPVDAAALQAAAQHVIAALALRPPADGATPLAWLAEGGSAVLKLRLCPEFACQSTRTEHRDARPKSAVDQGKSGADTVGSATMPLDNYWALSATLEPPRSMPAELQAGLAVLRTKPSDPAFTLPPEAGWKVEPYTFYHAAKHHAQHCGYPEALLWHPDGTLAEAIFSNLFLRIGGTWLTPALQPGGALPGITRTAVLAWLRQCGHPVEEATLTAADLVAADALFLTNSLRGLAPVSQLGPHRFPTMTLAELQALRGDFEKTLQ